MPPVSNPKVYPYNKLDHRPCGKETTTTVSNVPTTKPTINTSRITRLCTARILGSSTTRSGPNTFARVLSVVGKGGMVYGASRIDLFESTENMLV